MARSEKIDGGRENVDPSAKLPNVGSNASDRRLLVIMIAYFCVLEVVATIFQRRSGLAPWVDGGPIEHFTSSVLWIMSFVCIWHASALLGRTPRAWLWFLASAAAGILSIDEYFAFHERSSRVVGDDDHIKVAQLLVAGAALLFMNRIERWSPIVKKTIAAGYAIHILYILCDLGDGDLMKIPFFTVTQLRWIEEYLEMSSLAGYTMGIVLLRAEDARRS